MTTPQITDGGYERPETGDRQAETLKFMVPLPARPRAARLNFPNGLVASSDEEVLQVLAENMRECHLPTFLAFTAGESKRVVNRHELSVVVCDDRLIDGNYQDILSVAKRLRASTPVIVVSPTGDWPDYLKAISAGAFDYMAYPLLPGELSRVIRNALARTTGTAEGTATHVSNSWRGEIT